MSDSGLPADLDAALRALAHDPDPAPEAFERVARWRRACGDAEAAATWQTWSLLPPGRAELRLSLASLWRSAGDLQQATALLQSAEAITGEPGWETLALTLQKGELEAASKLQARLLATRPNLAVPKLLDLLRLWKQHGQAPQALALLEPLLHWIDQQGDTPSGQLCNVMADLLEQEQRFDEAEPWWQRSHALQPQQAWPLIRLGHQALRRNQPAIALHYSRQVLSRDPAHHDAPELQTRALNALGATQSLALLAGPPQHVPIRPLADPPPLELWLGCRSIALVGFSEARLLLGWCAQLQEQMKHAPAPAQRELWLIASPDPLWLEHQTQQLLGDVAHRVAISSWPVWDPRRHGHCDRVFHCKSTAPFWREQESER